MTSLLSKRLVSVLGVCFLLFFVATANAKQALKAVATVDENSAQWQQTLNRLSQTHPVQLRDCPQN